MRTQIAINHTKPYDFSHMLRVHGWAALHPFSYLPDLDAFSRIEQLPCGQVVEMVVSDAARSRLPHAEIQVQVAHPARLDRTDRSYLISSVRHMLRLDEDLAPFYVLCREKGGVWKNLDAGQGFLLRSPTLFEDMVKVILTTNIQWSGTKRMVRELVQQYGEPLWRDAARKTFPTPAALMRDTLDVFQRKVHLGYRAAYVYQLAAEFAEKPEKFLALADPSIPAGDLIKQLLAIKGIGNYAAASILMLLGRYEYIPVDTVFRDFVRQKYQLELPINQQAAVNLYQEWGHWKYLAYWFDMYTWEPS